MDVIIIGVYSSEDKERLDKEILTLDQLEIIWDYKKYNIEAIKGIVVLEAFYNLFQTGILVEKNRNETFSSYPIICEVTDAFIGLEIKPKLFHFFKMLENANINKMIISFADEWNEKDLVKIEKCEIQNLENRLNNLFVWCESLRDIIHNRETRDDYHPLILEVQAK